MQVCQVCRVCLKMLLQHVAFAGGGGWLGTRCADEDLVTSAEEKHLDFVGFGTTVQLVASAGCSRMDVDICGLSGWEVDGKLMGS